MQENIEEEDKMIEKIRQAKYGGGIGGDGPRIGKKFKEDDDMEGDFEDDEIEKITNALKGMGNMKRMTKQFIPSDEEEKDGLKESY